MTPESLKTRRLAGLFLLGCVLLNFPILSLFNRNAFILGIPILYVYLFSVWALLILLSILVSHFDKDGAKSSDRRRGA